MIDYYMVLISTFTAHLKHLFSLISYLYFSMFYLSLQFKQFQEMLIEFLPLVALLHRRANGEHFFLEKSKVL